MAKNIRGHFFAGFDCSFQYLYNSFRVTIEKIYSLLEPFIAPDSISPEQSQQVHAYLDLLLKWNEKINLTAIRPAEEIVTRHFGESFFAVREFSKLQPSPASAVDVGSGAGFPGLPIKIWFPEVQLTLVESNHKKVAFLREAVRILGLKNVEVLAIRAEEASSKFELVTLRAVERFEKALSIAAALLLPRGFLVLLIGESQVAIAQESLPNFTYREPIPIPLSEKRVLLIAQR